MRNAETRGFTLLEVLVALAIFAVSALVLLQQSGRSARQLYTLESRTLADWIAENELARLRLQANLPATGEKRSEIRFGSRDWILLTDVESTTRDDLRRVSVRVFEPTNADQHVFELTGFVGRH